MLNENGDHDAAVAGLEDLLVDRQATQHYAMTASAFLVSGQPREMTGPRPRLRFRELLTLDPSDSKARWALILVLLRRGLVSEARQVYDEAPAGPTSQCPNTPVHRWRLDRQLTVPTTAVLSMR